MDYEFRRNTFDDSFHCEFSMGHEAVGRWLLDEIGTDTEILKTVIENIEAIIEKGGEWQRPGREFHLWLDKEEAIIKANALDENAEFEIDQNDGLHNTYDEESIASCGLEDLLNALLSWQDFLAQYGKKSFSLF